VCAVACTATSRPPSTEAAAGIDSLNARVVQAYRAHDPQLYGTLWTDSAQFEWPAFTTVKGRAQMSEMARGNWATLKDMDLKLIVNARRLEGEHATEFGAFEQSWNDSSGTRMTEYGRYVTYLVRGKDGRWLMDRFFGFEDSTRARPRRSGE
jgi:ketosteroid isomerase-like protein